MAVGNDNSEMMAQWEEAQLILKNIDYNTEDGGLLASVARTTDGLLSGMVMLDTNFLGIFAQDTALFRGLVTGVRPSVPTPTEFLQMLNDDPSLGEVANYLGLAFLKYNPVTLTAENLYRMNSALLAGNWVELRNASVDLLGLGLLTKWAVTPAGRRDIQLKEKQVEFLQQQLRRGVIEETSLKDLANEKSDSQVYVVQSTRVDSTGKPLPDGRVLTVESFAEATKGIAEVTDTGKVRYKNAMEQEVALEARIRAQEIKEECFVSDTLVHIRLDEATYPIMKPYIKPDPYRHVEIGVPIVCEIQYLRPGVEVLSRCEETGEIAYRRVVEVFEHFSSGNLFHLTYHSDGPWGSGHIFVTDSHRFWVVNKGWVKVRDLELEDTFLTFDSVPAHLTSKKLDQYDFPVYNLSVEGFHTYFVTGDGIWVHNTKDVKVEIFNGLINKDAVPHPGKYESKPEEMHARETLAL